MEIPTEPKVFAGISTQSGNTDGDVITARFGFIGSIVAGPEEDLLLVDSSFNSIRHITRDGIVSTLIDKHMSFIIESPHPEEGSSIRGSFLLTYPLIAALNPNREIVLLKHHGSDLLIFKQCQFVNVIIVPQIEAMADSYHAFIRYFHITPSNRILITTGHSIFFVDGETLYDIGTWKSDLLHFIYITGDFYNMVDIFGAAILDDNGVLWIVMQLLVKVVDGHCVDIFSMFGLCYNGIDAITIAPDGRIFYVGASNRHADSTHTVIGVFNPINETSEILCECREYHHVNTLTVRGSSLYVPHGPCILQVDF